MSRQGRREDLEGFLDFDGGLAVVLGTAQERRENVDVVGAEDGVHPRGLGDDAVAHLLSQAASDRNLHARTLTLDGGQLAEVTKEASRGVLTNRAGVDDDDVGTHVARVCRARGGLGDRVNGDEACLLQQTRHSFGVVFVHLTAKRAHRVGARQGV